MFIVIMILISFNRNTEVLIFVLYIPLDENIGFDCIMVDK